MWMIYAALSSVTAALVAVFAKIGLREVDATVATVIRGIIMATILTLGAVAFGKFKGFSVTDLSGKAWLFVLLAAFAGAASWLFYFIALKGGPAGTVAVIDKMSVVLVLILAALFLGESFTIKSAIGAVLLALGGLLIVLK